MKEIVLREYPNAQTGEQITEKYLNFLETEYKSDLGKMLFATSLCSDDINISTDFRKVLKRPFVMGGLGGMPFTGFTGMVAFAHHIPDGGDAFIFYAPHIGITQEGELGKMLRPGQKHITNSCGALMLALERIQNDSETYVPYFMESDYQQMILEKSLMPYKHQICTAENPKKEITEVVYKEIHKQVHNLVKMAKSEFCCDRVFLLGGIIINTNEEYNDYVDVKNFTVYNLANLEEIAPVSILKSTAFKNL